MAEVKEVYKPVETRRPLLREIQYKKGFENRVAAIPIIEEETPINLAFTWGKNSQNMSPKYLGEGETAEGNVQRVVDFLTSQGMSKPPNLIHTIARFDGEFHQIEEVALDNIDPQATAPLNMEANFVFTRDPRITLIIRPADCPVSVLYAKDWSRRNIIGICHSSGLSTNAGVQRMSIEHLIEDQNVDPSTIKIGILPGVSQNNFYLVEEPGVTPILEGNWGDNITPKDPYQGKDQKRYVDLLGATIMQFEKTGVDPANIQAYDIDTFEAAKRGESFSYEYTKETGLRQGRFLVAAQLASESMIQILQSSSK